MELGNNYKILADILLDRVSVGLLKQVTFAIGSLVSLHTSANESSICFCADSSIAARVRVTLVFLLRKKKSGMASQ